MRSFFDLPPDFGSDLDKLKEQADLFAAGSLSPVEFRAFRVPLGVYEQREEGLFMLRVRFPAGGVLPHQMRALASVSRRYGSGALHVTTRQDIQIHRVTLEKIHPALVDLFDAGLSTKGGGGNTVRNITACSDAGVCPHEVFDVAPWAAALTELLLPDPLSYRLPRKFKIAFSGCSRDCAGAQVNDVGFLAAGSAREPGFAVYVGGGMGAQSRLGVKLDRFVPADRIHLTAEAVKRVFDRFGNRRNKHKARLRFFLEDQGLEKFRELYAAVLAELEESTMNVRDCGGRSLTVPEKAEPPAEDFETWRARNTRPQKQEGYYIVHIPLALGDIAPDSMERLADLVRECGEGMVRATQEQNLVIRWVHENELSALHRNLSGIGLAAAVPRILMNAVSCAGASTCQLGICLSRGATAAITDALSRGGRDLDRLAGIGIHVSGCPNSCGRHPVADVGIFGAARRIDGRLVPHYVIQTGGKTDERFARLAEGTDAIPARAVPAFIADFLDAFLESPEYPDYSSFLAERKNSVMRDLSARHGATPAYEDDDTFFYDWGAESLFSLAGRGPGECGAGVFDLIEVDLASAEKSLGEGKLRDAVVLASRALLVTQGLEAGRDEEALLLFEKHFILEGLVSGSCNEIIEKARYDGSLSSREVGDLILAVKGLYASMDQSLRFRPQAPQAPPIAEASDLKIDREADFRGLACPLNYVKTKLILDRMSPGQVLAVLLDRQGARNVPESAGRDGHHVLSVVEEQDRWRVVIRRG